MKLVTYVVEKKQKLGVLSTDEQWVLPFDGLEIDYKDMKTAAAKLCESELQRLDYAASHDPYRVRGAARREEVKLLAPIPEPGQDIICLGINYMAHAEESARYRGKEFDGQRPHAVYFSKRVNRATGDGEEIPAHQDITERLDYEAELAVVIGRDAYRVPEEKAADYVFGYTILNDISARDIQDRHQQWYFGKSLEGACPMGPCIVTADQIAYPPRLAIRSYVNGELRQDSHTSLLIFGISSVISELSQGMCLKAGTIISMGTPSGAGIGFDPPRFLKPGDEVICEVEGIGRLRNVIA